MRDFLQNMDKININVWKICKLLYILLLHLIIMHHIYLIIFIFSLKFPTIPSYFQIINVYSRKINTA